MNDVKPEEILRLNSLWDEMDKQTMVNKINMVFDYDFPFRGRNRRGHLYRILSYVTQSSSFAAESWTNASRENVKCPFLKYCQICDVFGLPLKGMLLKEDNDWFDDDMREHVHNVVVKVMEEMKND